MDHASVQVVKTAECCSVPVAGRSDQHLILGEFGPGLLPHRLTSQTRRARVDSISIPEAMAVILVIVDVLGGTSVNKDDSVKRAKNNPGNEEAAEPAGERVAE